MEIFDELVGTNLSTARARLMGQDSPLPGDWMVFAVTKPDKTEIDKDFEKRTNVCMFPALRDA